MTKRCWAFDALGHKVWVDGPNMGQKTFAYSAVGELLTEQDVNCPTSIGCDTVSMEYDALGRLRKRYANGSLVGHWIYDDPAPDKGPGLRSYEENLSGPHGLQKHYFYSLDGSGRKDLTRVLHRFYVNGSPHTDYITRYYIDSYYGRVYDYNLGRFLSVDPIIQAPGNSQSLNPYSYIMNNPLSGTDPSGYSAVEEECQIKPASCRAVMAAEFGGMNSGLIGNFGIAADCSRDSMVPVQCPIHRAIT